MKVNQKPSSAYTHQGGRAKRVGPELELTRTVMACLLWERQFYEGGEDIAARIQKLVPLVSPDAAARTAVYAREKMNLRHAPLLVAREMARHRRHKPMVANVLNRIIQRPDELTEFLAIYWKEGRQPLSAQVKKGLASAFKKFDVYQLAKYNRKDAIKLRDVLRLCHPKPMDSVQDENWRLLRDDALPTPDTWETQISAVGSDTDRRREVWTRLLSEWKMGALAILRNLRNFAKDGVPKDIVISALHEANVRRVLPFRFISAARVVPSMEPDLEDAMFCSTQARPHIPGKTCLLVDVSESMGQPLSTKSMITCMDVACGLAMLVRELCEEAHIYSFSMKLVEIPPRRGFALRDAVVNSQSHSRTYLGRAVKATEEAQGEYDRLIVITDEQSDDPVPDPTLGKGYMINVASYRHGVGYGSWIHIDGWSEAVLDYIHAVESEDII